MNDMLTQFMALGGIALFIATLVNVLKAFHVIQDGQAPTYSFVLNLGAFVIFSVVGWFKPGVEWAAIDSTLAAIANVAITIFKLATQVLISKLGHENVLKTVPVLGFSYSARAAAKKTKK